MGLGFMGSKGLGSKGLGLLGFKGLGCKGLGPSKQVFSGLPGQHCMPRAQLQPSNLQPLK